MALRLESDWCSWAHNLQPFPVHHVRQSPVKPKPFFSHTGRGPNAMGITGTSPMIIMAQPPCGDAPEPFQRGLPRQTQGGGGKDDAIFQGDARRNPEDCSGFRTCVARFFPVDFFQQGKQLLPFRLAQTPPGPAGPSQKTPGDSQQRPPVPFRSDSGDRPGLIFPGSESPPPPAG